MERYKVLGLMSGTSLDGLDLAYAEFISKSDTWEVQHIISETLPYSNEFRLWLSTTMECSGAELMHRHMEYGIYLGKSALKFIHKHQLQPELIASHGHTIFHQPEHGYTFQLGHGSGIRAITGLKTVWDFRTLDVMLGGQGAPLVPIGDRLLFGNYDACLNLGGICNISFENKNQRIAFDISPFNLVYNWLSKKLGLEFDSGGYYASNGTLNTELLYALNQVEFYSKTPPRSLGKEWIDKNILPLFENYPDSVENHLHTFTIHVAVQIAEILKKYAIKNVLITGGGTYNQFFIDQLKKITQTKIIIPTDVIINFKEAIIFALLGVLRIRNEINILSSVTGAICDSTGGIIT